MDDVLSQVDQALQREQQIYRNQQLRIATESSEEREVRLQKRLRNQQLRIAAESSEEREVRLQKRLRNQQLRIAAESSEEREVRLQKLLRNQPLRIVAESSEEREVRLQQVLSCQQLRIAIELACSRYYVTSNDDLLQKLHKRLQQDRERHMQQASLACSSHVHLNHPAVQSKMHMFHHEMASLSMVSLCHLMIFILASLFGA